MAGPKRGRAILLVLVLLVGSTADYVRTANYLASDGLASETLYSYVLTMQNCMPYYPACTGSSPATCDALPGGASLPWANPPYAPLPGAAAASSAAAVGALAQTNQSITCSSPTGYAQLSDAAPSAAGSCGTLAPAPAPGTPSTARTVGQGAAFTAHPPISAAAGGLYAGQPAALALATRSQCVQGDASAALKAAAAGARTTNAYYTLYTDLASNGPAGRCNAAMAVNVTTEIFPYVFTCLPVPLATSDDDLFLPQGSSSSPNPSRSVMVSCDSATGSLRSTIYGSANCDAATVLSVLNYSVAGCANLTQWTSGAFRTTVTGFCAGAATPSQPPSATPLRLSWQPPVPFWGPSSDAPPAWRPGAVALALALALAAAAAAAGGAPL